MRKYLNHDGRPRRFERVAQHTVYAIVWCAAIVLLVGSVTGQPQTAPGKPQPTPTPTPQTQPPSSVTGSPNAGQKPQSGPPAGTVLTPRKDPFSPQLNAPAPAPAPTALPPIANYVDWRFTVKSGQIVSSSITAENVCHSRHRFEVVNPPLPAFMRLRGESVADVNPLGQHLFPVEFDASGLRTGIYQGTVVVKCLTCREEKGCAQDREILRIYMTVEPQKAGVYVPGRVLAMMP